MKQYFIDSELLGVVESKIFGLTVHPTLRKRQITFRELSYIAKMLFLPKGKFSITYLGFGTDSKGQIGMIVVTDEPADIAEVSRTEVQGIAIKENKNEVD